MKKLIFALMVIALLVPAVAAACPTQLQLNVTAKAFCDGSVPKYSVGATATESWDGWTLIGITGTGSGEFTGPTKTYEVEAKWSKQVVDGGHYEYVDKPYTLGCDIDTWIHGNKHDVSQFYNKPTGDEKHCHRIVWGNLSTAKQDAFKAMHGNRLNYGTGNHGSWEAAYNHHIDQNPLATKTYSSCPTGYKPSVLYDDKCVKWVDEFKTIYDHQVVGDTLQRPVCNIPHTVVVSTANTCLGTSAAYSLDGGAWQYIMQFNWADSYGPLETKNYNLFDVFTEQGAPHTYTYSGEAKSGTITEPSECAYQTCQVGNIEELDDCTDPVLNTETLLYEWTCKARDINTPQVSCDDVDHNSDYVECTDTKEVHNKKETKLVDIYTGAVCKIVDTECTSDKYMQATFEKEGQPNCYLVSWDGYPAATRSQLCNCGWIADNMSEFGMVEYNSCTNEYIYDGEVWPWFKEEMLEPHWGDGACLNVGGC